MKFDDKYPDAGYMDQYEFEGSFIVKDKHLKSCCICKSDTYWMDGSLQDYFCSEECVIEWGDRMKKDMRERGIDI